MDNKHCPDHCDLLTSIIEIKKDTEYIKQRLSASWGDIKWFIAIIPGIAALLIDKIK